MGAMDREERERAEERRNQRPTPKRAKTLATIPLLDDDLAGALQVFVPPFCSREEWFIVVGASGGSRSPQLAERLPWRSPPPHLTLLVPSPRISARGTHAVSTSCIWIDQRQSMMSEKGEEVGVLLLQSRMWYRNEASPPREVQ